MVGYEVMYCTISEAAKILGVSRPTVYRMIKDGELKKLMMLGRPAFKVSEVRRRAGKSTEAKLGPRK